MITTADVAEVRKLRWTDSEVSWGLVPTMGYLHDGHLSLVRHARTENQKVAVSIYINPSQFGPDEDLAEYPRDVERDLALLQRAGVDLVFAPTDEVMYPPGFQTTVSVERVSRPLEGSARPTHFQGVTTIVAKLFNIFQPHRAYFGQKDAQQTIVLRQMVHDLDFNLEIVVCPTVREPDGLAMSSRNAYLSLDERQSATVLYRALTRARAAIEKGETSGDVLRELMKSVIDEEKLARVDYVSVADPFTLSEVKDVGQRVLLSGAIFVGSTRLIDNIPVERVETNGARSV